MNTVAERRLSKRHLVTDGTAKSDVIHKRTRIKKGNEASAVVTGRG